MTLAQRFLDGLRGDRGGSVVVEFALIAPVLLMLLLGVVQIGMAMQQYNALRGVAADVARYAVVNYQANNKLSTATLATYGTSVAGSSPYNIPATGRLITVTEPATQRVTGAKEYSITVRAQVNNIIGFVNFKDYYISYTRPIFVLP